MNPSGPVLKPTGCETATDCLERAYAYHTANARADWLPPGFNAQAADSAAVAAEGIAKVDELTTSHDTKTLKPRS